MKRIRLVSLGIVAVLKHRWPTQTAQARTASEDRSGRGERWKVERTFAWLGSFRRLLVRHERYPSIFRAFFLVASIIISLRRF